MTDAPRRRPGGGRGAALARIFAGALLCAAAAGVPAAPPEPRPADPRTGPATAGRSGPGGSVEAMLAGEPAARLEAALAAGTVADVPRAPQLALALGAGMRHPDVRGLRRFLRGTGDYRAEMGADPWLFDRNLAEALVRFQHRHGLPASGITDAATRAVLAWPEAERTVRLEAALARWRALPAATERYLWVDLGAAEVSAVAHGAVRLAARAVIGRAERPTPELSSAIHSITVRPTWTLPPTIIAEDLLPRLATEPDLLARLGLRVFEPGPAGLRELDPTGIDWPRVPARGFPYVLRQPPGPDNALGRLRFNFPNPYAVFLHDTPRRADFDRDMRAQSSGCVRVDEAVALARWLVGDARAPRLDRALASGTTVTLTVTPPVPIHIVAVGAWVDRDGALQFREPPYRDPSPVTQQAR